MIVHVLGGIILDEGTTLQSGWRKAVDCARKALTDIAIDNG